MTTDPAYDQVREGIEFVRGLTLALTGLQQAANNYPQPVVAEAALHNAISRALDDLESLLEAHYHPTTQGAAGPAVAAIQKPSARVIAGCLGTPLPHSLRALQSIVSGCTLWVPNMCLLTYPLAE